MSEDDVTASRVAVTPYERIGGETRVRALVDRFYDLMDLEPRMRSCARVHGNDLADTRATSCLVPERLAGRPGLYIERFGHPRLRARHLPFSIGVRERDQWMACMNQAMIEQGVDEDLRLRLVQAFFRTADRLVNEMCQQRSTFSNGFLYPFLDSL